MKNNATTETIRTAPSDIKSIGASAIDSFDIFISGMEKHLPWLSVLSLLIGMGLAKISEPFAQMIDNGMNLFIDSYGYIAPVAIYMILTPTLTRLFTSAGNSGKKFANHTIRWFVISRIIACVWAVIFTAVVFGMPLYSTSAVSFTDAITKAIKSMGWMLTHSIYFYALYASVFTVFLSIKYKRVAKTLDGGADLIEALGKYFIPMVPLFMLAIGAYITYLPVSLEEQIGLGNMNNVSIGSLNILGITISTNTSLGMIMAYLFGAALTGLACIIWHSAFIMLVKIKMPEFSIKEYFMDYWVKIYPLLWSTSSEALSTPLNLYLIKKRYPMIRDEVRQFVVGSGSILNINGTMICVFVLAGLVAGILNIQISFLQLLLSVPIVVLIGYGVPGIPGELLLFGGPMVICLGIAPEWAPIFLGLYLGLQIGLPDSFRTGNNSTDNCLYAIVLEQAYKKLED
ncbi:Dicarboxylate/amino acid:cation symporter [Candidatus Magnetomoraceae bacterium gMMP-15]